MPLNIDWQQILLHVFNFVVLFAILYFLLYKPVKDFMDKRQKYYEDMDRAANEKLAESENAKAEYTNKLASVEDELAMTRENAQKELDASLAACRREAEDEAAKIIADAKLAAEREREKILKGAQGEIADMVTVAAEKIISARSTSDAFDQFLAGAQRSEDDE